MGFLFLDDITYDPALGATVALSDTALKLGETATLTATFSEAAMGLTTADFTIPGGSLSNLSSSDGGVTFTCTYTPPADTEQTGNSITLDLSGVTNYAGTAGSGMASSPAFSVDTRRPSAAVTGMPGTLIPGGTANVTFTFSEKVTGFDASDLTVTGGAVSALSSADGGKTYTGTFTAGSATDEGLITLNLAGVLDAAGNAGTGTAASSAFNVAPTVPGAPAVSSVTPGDGMATVAFTAPASDGGAAISGYTVTASPGNITASGTSSPIAVTGLTNGTAYTFTVAAANSVGTGASSAASATATPKASQTITFANPGPQTFGTTPTLTASASSGLAVTFTTSTPGVCLVTPEGIVTFLTAGTATISADQGGSSVYNAASTVTQSFAVNAAAPGAPTGVTAEAGDTQAVVSFSAPSFTGGASVTGYTVTASPGNITAAGTASPITVTGLANGTAYTFTVAAANSAGTGASSAASAAVTPKASQTITFGDPGPQTFGTTPTLTASASSGLAVTFTTSTPEVCSVTPAGTLTFLAAGTASVTAHQAGNGAYLAAADVTRSFTVNAAAPGAPTGVKAEAGNAQAVVSFSAPASTGGAAITGYTVTASPGNITAAGTASPITVTGLTNGTAYTFTVAAANSAGTGASSAASAAVTPKASQTITFGDPGTQTFGTTPTLTASASSGLAVTFTTSTPEVCSVTPAGALTFLAAGTASVTAHQAGNGAYLAAADVTHSFTVAVALSGAPTGVKAAAGNGQASVSFTAPTETGGGAITSYLVTAAPGGATATGAASPVVIKGLNNGTAYTFTVQAVNSAGAGTGSAPSAAVTPAAPVIGGSAASAPAVTVTVDQKTVAQASAVISTVNGVLTAGVRLDESRTAAALGADSASPVVNVTLDSRVEAASVSLGGTLAQTLADRGAVLTVQVGQVKYELPAAAIDLSSLAGGPTADTAVTLTIRDRTGSDAAAVRAAAGTLGANLVSRVWEFGLTTQQAGTEKELPLRGMVRRFITIDKEISADKVMTGVVLRGDGTLYSVPTRTVQTGSAVSAVVSSPTNSVYAVISRSASFADMSGHWAKTAVEDMGARLVLTGAGGGLFKPGRAMTRAEFTAAVVRALGISPASGSAFADVKAGSWYAGYAAAAAEYGLISDQGLFRPSAAVTRQEAMTILARAMKLTGLDAAPAEEETAALLGRFADGAQVAAYARTGAAACLKNGVVSGASESSLAPGAAVTRAEGAAMLQRLLNRSGLI